MVQFDIVFFKFNYSNSIINDSILNISIYCTLVSGSQQGHTTASLRVL